MRHGIVTSLPISDEVRPPKARTPRPAPKAPSRGEKDQVLDVIVGLIDPFCKEHLNDNPMAWMIPFNGFNIDARQARESRRDFLH